MSKKRKTKKEKLVSQNRASHLSYSSTDNVYSFDDTTVKRPVIHETQANISHGYVIQDAKRTLFITSLLIIAGFVLFFLIQTNIIKLVYFGY